MAVIHINYNGEPVGEVEPSGTVFFYNGAYIDIQNLDDGYYDPWEDDVDEWDNDFDSWDD